MRAATEGVCAMRRLLPSVFSAIAAAVSIFAGCGSSGHGYDNGPNGGPLGGDNPNLNGDGGGGVNCTQAHCSSDLHSLVDCNGIVLMTCPPDQGCSGTRCVAACDSAKDNKSNIGC